MALGIGSTGTALVSYGNGTKDVALPADAAAGKFCVVAAGCSGLDNTQLDCISDGWYGLVAKDSDNFGFAGYPALNLAIKELTADDITAGVVSFTVANGTSDTTFIGQTKTFTGLSLNTAPEQNTTQSNGLQNINLPALGSWPAGSLVIAVGSKDKDWTSVAPPSNALGTYTEIGEVNDAAFDAFGLTWAYIEMTGTATVASGSFTVTGGATAKGVGAQTVFSTVTLITGSLTSTLGNVTSAATGTIAVEGVAALTLAAATLASAGVLDTPVTGNITLGGVSTTADGAISLSGSAPITLGNFTTDSEGLLIVGPVGGLDVTLADAIVASTIETQIGGTATISLGNATLEAEGSFPVTGVAALTLSTTTLTSDAGVAVTGSASFTLAPLTLSGAIGAVVTGSLSATLGHFGVTSQMLVKNSRMIINILS